VNALPMLKRCAVRQSRPTSIQEVRDGEAMAREYVYFHAHAAVIWGAIVVSVDGRRNNLAITVKDGQR
jgi:hypothetical protein